MKRIVFYFIIYFFVSCSTHDDLAIEDKDSCQNCFVGIEEAESLATMLRISTEKTAKSKSAIEPKPSRATHKQIEAIVSVRAPNNQTAYYIVTYKGGGFIVLSADKRANPILAFSETDSFPMDMEQYPTGLVEWLGEAKEYIQALRVSNNEISYENTQAWLPCALQRAARPPGGGDDDCIGGCPNSSTTVGPLLQTEWHQGYGFNDHVPLTGCANTGNGIAPVGSVATAMGQIMKYYEYPNNYNWGNMGNYYGSNDAAQLMVDIGTAVNMDYGCGGSGTETKATVASAFKNTFGYSSATYSDFNQQTVIQQLNANRPVILRGGEASGWWIFVTYKYGHAWVCDGYQRSMVYSQDCSASWEYLYLHMNWGWGSSTVDPSIN